MLLDRLAKLASSNAPLFTWVDESGGDAATLDAPTLLARAQTLSGMLRGPCGLRPGDRAVLAYMPSLAFIEGLVACLQAGVVPVPCYLPDPRKKGDVQRFRSIVESAGARVALTDAGYRWAQHAS